MTTSRQLQFKRMLCLEVRPHYHGISGAVRYQSLKYPYIIANAAIAYSLMTLVLLTSGSLLMSRIPEILILSFLIGGALSFQINLPRSNIEISLLNPFYALSVLMLDKLAIVPCFLGWLFWIIKGYKEQGKDAFSIPFALWTPVSEAPMVFLASFSFHSLGGRDFANFHDVPWIAFCALVLSWFLMDAVVHNTFSGIVHGESPWKMFLSNFIGYYDVPLTPLAIPVYLLYKIGGVQLLVLHFIPIFMLLWLVRRFFQEANKREESMGHLNVASELIRSTLNFDELVAAVAEKVREALGADGLELFLKTPNGWQPKTVLGKSPWMKALPPSGFLKTLDEIPLREPTNLSNLSQEPSLSWYREAGLPSILAIPLYSGDETLGIIFCTKEVQYYFHGYHIEFAKALIGQVSQALVSARLHAQLVSTLEELRATQSQLIQSEKMAGLGKLAAGVAHEINNPLGAIVINAESLLKEMGEKRSLAIILNAAQKAKAIVESLLPFSRQSKGKETVFELNKVIQECLQMWEKQLELAKIKIQSQVSGNPKIVGKPEELIQVISNLISNAKDAFLEKEGTEKLIQITARENSNAVIIEVTDNGSGIPEQNLSKIFEPFFTTKEIGKGTGLGLSVSYAIVSAMQGKIEARSKVGEGTTFTLSFPLPRTILNQQSIVDKALNAF